jgi:hypothetical protein
MLYASNAEALRERRKESEHMPRVRLTYEVVGYRGKSGKLGAYKKLGEYPDKFNPGKRRAKLQSFDGKLNFFVDADALEAPPPRKGLSGEVKHCWECGCAFDYRICKENDGDWSDSYCGC